MKPRLARELALISLPLLFIAASAWLLSGNGRELLPARFDNGPARFGFSEMESIEVAPVDVYRGYDWTGRTQFWQRGKFDMPAGWTLFSAGAALTDNQRLVYRRGQTWHKVEDNSRQIIDSTSGSDGDTFFVNLEPVPADAEEVHLRGEFHWIEMYSGALPAGWKPPANYARHGLRNVFTLPAQPFDVTIVAPGQPPPRPTVSRESGIEVVKATYGVYDDLGVLMQLRRKPGFDRPDTGQLVRLLSLKLIDAQGHKLDICDATGQRVEPPGLGYIKPEIPELPATDFVVGASAGNFRRAQPRGGWSKYRGPFRLEAVVSDENRWPLTVTVPVPAS